MKKLFVVVLAVLAVLSSVTGVAAAYGWGERSVETTTMILSAGTFDVTGLQCEDATPGVWATCTATVVNESGGGMLITDVTVSSNKADYFGGAQTVASPSPLAAGQKGILKIQWMPLPTAPPEEIGIIVFVTAEAL